MAILQKLAFISMILNLNVMNLMQFNDLHLLCMCIWPFCKAYIGACLEL